MQILSLPIACLLRHVQADDARRSVPVCLGTTSGNRSMMNVAIPILAGVIYVSLCSLFKEPSRISFNAIMIAGAAYLSGGFGVWEFAFTAVVTFCAYRGLRSYPFSESDGFSTLFGTCSITCTEIQSSPLFQRRRLDALFVTR